MNRSPMYSLLRQILFGGLLLATAAVSAEQRDGFQLLGVEQLQQLTDADKYQQPTLLAFWSLDCSYCKRQLQELAARANAGQLQLVTLLVESPGTEQAQVLEALQVSQPWYAWADGMPEALAHASDPDWYGELPRTLIFDGQGQRAARSGLLPDELLEQLQALRRD